MAKMDQGEVKKLDSEVERNRRVKQKAIYLQFQETLFVLLNCGEKQKLENWMKLESNEKLK